MDDILARVEIAARGYPVRVPNNIWGEVEYRFVLPPGASDGDLEKARKAVDVPLPAPFEGLLRRWNAPSLESWAADGTYLEHLEFLSTHRLAKIGSCAIRELNEDGRVAVKIAGGYGCELLMEPGREEVLIQEECVGRYFLLCPSLGDFLEMLLRDGPTDTPSWTRRELWRPLPEPNG
jgi:hypothetical protein